MALISTLRTSIAALFATLSAGCAAGAPTAEHVESTPTAEHMEEVVACGQERPITATLVNHAAQIDGLHGIVGRGDLLIGHLSYMREPQEEAEAASGAVLFFKRADGWRAIVPLQQENAVGIFSARQGRGLLVVVQRQIGDPGQSFTMVRTEDDFTTSTCATLRFPAALNQPTWNGEFLELHDLDIDAGGRGALIGSAGLDRQGEAPRTLWFAYDTRDGGRTWSAPRALAGEGRAPAGAFVPAEQARAPALEADLRAYAARR